MRKYFAALIAALFMAAGLQTITLSPADATITRKGCATKYEWRKISRGDTLQRTRGIIGHNGRLVDQTEYSDGDEYRTYKFRQCGRSWARSSLYVYFSLTERERWVPDEYCYEEDYDYDGYPDDYVCEDYGYYETYYSGPFRAYGKYAYWG